MWPGLVGKGDKPGQEQPIDLAKMLDLTSKARTPDGRKFHGVDLFLFDPHVSIHSTKDDIKKLAEQIAALEFVVGDTVAPVWPGTKGDSILIDPKAWLESIRLACQISAWLREFKIRPYGIVRIDTATSGEQWAKVGQSKAFSATVATIKESCNIANGFGERLAAEGEPNWAGMNSTRRLKRLIKTVDRPEFGGQLDLAHLANFALGVADSGDRALPGNWKKDDWKNRPEVVNQAFRHIGNELSPYMFSLHGAQTDGGLYTADAESHAPTGHHVPVDDPNGVLDITACTRELLYEDGEPRAGLSKTGPKHICWDGCMFPNDKLLDQETWNKVLTQLTATADALPI